MNIKLKHRIRFYLAFLRQRTPYFNGQVKQIVWGDDGGTHAEIPRIIWLYWDEESITSITVQLCVDHIRYLHPDYNVHVLSRRNLFDHLPDFPMIVLEKTANFSSDLVRLMLLERYGGIYLDATVLLSRKLDWAILQQQRDQSEALLYYTDENTRQLKYPMIEAWFIIARPESKFIKAWREEYQSCITSADPEKYYLNNMLLSIDDFPMDSSYYLSYMAAQIVMRRTQDYRLSLLRAEDDAYLYSLKVRRKWGEIALAEILLLNDKPKALPNMVKIIRYGRNRLDFLIKRNFFKERSWLGSLLKSLNG